MMEWFNRVIEEVKGMKHFQNEGENEYPSVLLEVSESERHPSFTILNEDGSSAIATYRFDTETQHFYKEVSGLDTMHYGNDYNFLTMRLYFQTISQLKNNIDDILNETPATYTFMSKLEEAISDEKYYGIEVEFENNFDRTFTFSVVKGDEIIEKYNFNVFKKSDFDNYDFEVYTSNGVKCVGGGAPIETRILYPLYGAVADAVKKVDKFLAQ